MITWDVLCLASGPFAYALGLMKAVTRSSLRVESLKFAS